MAKTLNTTGSASDAIIDGLAEALHSDTKAAKALKLAELKKGAKSAERNAIKLQAWKDRTADRNPQVLVDTVRSVPVGDTLDNGLISKGRVVDIECETCNVIRTVNVQDAFQVRFCEEHKAESKKAAAKAQRQAKKVAELVNLDESELDRQIAELESAVA